MKDLIILTDKPITSLTCQNTLVTYFKSLLLLNNDEDTLYMKKGKRGFELWFTPNDILDDPKSMMEDTVKRCPNKKAFLTNLCYTSKTIAKEIIEIIKPLYGKMWIQSDEEDDWFGTADDFINFY